MHCFALSAAIRDLGLSHQRQKINVFGDTVELPWATGSFFGNAVVADDDRLMSGDFAANEPF